MTNKFPEPVVGCFILNANRDILLVKSHKWPNQWVVMGGHIEWGETISSAAVRETKEELGLNIKSVRVLGVEEILQTEVSTNNLHLIAIQVECLLTQEYVPIFNDEVQEAKWFTISNALKLPDLTPNIKEGLKKLL